MNKDNAHEYLPLVQAIADGKIVQVQGGDGNWYNSKLINIPPRRYRIKPEPRTFEAYVNTTTGVITDGDNHKFVQNSEYDWERITVQEVVK